MLPPHAEIQVFCRMYFSHGEATISIVLMYGMELIKWVGLEWNGESDDALKKKFFFKKNNLEQRILQNVCLTY
jgi:hypothetical protein